MLAEDEGGLNDLFRQKNFLPTRDSRGHTRFRAPKDKVRIKDPHKGRTFPKLNRVVTTL